MTATGGAASTANGKKRVAIAVATPPRPSLTPDEEISLRHLMHYLAAFDRFAIAREGSDTEIPGCTTLHFSERFFGSVAKHAQLMLSPEFYERFADYDYVLTYHLDALVFSDRLLDWCALELDFIGGPWLDRESGRLIVGNGGFALRRVESFMRLLTSRDYAMDPVRYWERYCAGRSARERWLNLPRKYLAYFKPFNNVQRELRRNARMQLSDDTFLADSVPLLAPWFRIASLETALRFSFDNAPRLCYETNGGELPFGCHAWFKWDRAFWEPYLLRDAAELGGAIATGRS
jgi:hypothetical protein